METATERPENTTANEFFRQEEEEERHREAGRRSSTLEHMRIHQLGHIQPDEAHPIPRQILPTENHSFPRNVGMLTQAELDRAYRVFAGAGDPPWGAGETRHGPEIGDPPTPTARRPEDDPNHINYRPPPPRGFTDGMIPPGRVAQDLSRDAARRSHITRSLLDEAELLYRHDVRWDPARYVEHGSIRWREHPPTHCRAEMEVRWTESGIGLPPRWVGQVTFGRQQIGHAVPVNDEGGTIPQGARALRRAHALDRLCEEMARSLSRKIQEGWPQ